MKTSSYPHCCGVDILSQFGNTVTAVDSTKYTKEEIKKYILENRSEYNKKIEIVILNEEQIENIGKDLFVELEFKISEPMYYPGHGNNLFILTYNPNGSKPK
jgi:hypothetical protein